MLIMPQGHYQASAARRRLTLRERRILAAVATALAPLAAVLAIALAAGGHSTGAGCVDVNFAYSLGGQELFKCGTAAQQLCASVGTPGGYTGAQGVAISTACRREHYPVGSG